MKRKLWITGFRPEFSRVSRIAFSRDRHVSLALQSTGVGVSFALHFGERDYARRWA